jgi:hypothetical protein
LVEELEDLIELDVEEALEVEVVNAFARPVLVVVVTLPVVEVWDVDVVVLRVLVVVLTV